MKFSKFLSIFLAILMVLYVIPMSVFAEIRELATTDDNAEDYVIDPGSVPEDSAEVYGELNDKRSSDAKHFKMSDGSYVLVQYPENVHFKSENGYIEYDNTLEYTKAENENDFDGYKPVASDIDVKIASSANAEKLVELSYQKYSVIISSDEISSSSKVTVTNPEEKAIEGKDIHSASRLY